MTLIGLPLAYASLNEKRSTYMTHVWFCLSVSDAVSLKAYNIPELLRL